MRLVYAPEGAEPQSWVFDPNKIMSPEAEAIERATGWTFAEFGQQFLKGSTTARHALLWIMLRRKTPGIKYDEVQFSMAEVDVVFDDDELRAIARGLAERDAAGTLDAEELKAYEALRSILPPVEPEAVQDVPLPGLVDSGATNPAG